MATFATLIGVPTTTTDEFDHWEVEVRWPASCFYDDPRLHRTDPDWRDYLGAMTDAELREFRDAHGLVGLDETIDEVLKSDWTGYILIRCAEWEGY